MKKLFASLALCCIVLLSFGQRTWKQLPLQLSTRWSKEATPENALIEYPRPQMVRSDWQNLNGLWDYVITDSGAVQPDRFDGQILVPYPLESALSAVKKALLPNQNLWYKRNLSVNEKKIGKRFLLHFGAVDWQATVFVNGKEVGEHVGGYQGFSFDITDELKIGDNEIVVKVFDPTDQGIGPHGKQVLHPENIFYTASSGIWQTVWLESVPDIYIKDIKLTPDIDKGILDINVDAPLGSTIELVASADGKIVSQQAGKARSGIELRIPNAKLWSPAQPFLYDLQIKLMKSKKVIDEVRSYFGMRKISIGKDSTGVDRIFLNNKPYYNLGVLDQGFWPDGIYTAPTDEALAFDIKAIKAMGFNTIRKHIKVESARWYYHADKIGMLVWQDMVNPNQGLPDGSKPEFEKECTEIFDQLHNHPSITTWVLFNEKWGQYDQKRLTEWIKKTDPSRLVNGHTGELLYVNEQLRSPSPNAYVSADMTDVHSYPDPMMPIKLDGKAQVLGEFGGIGVFIADHQWITGSAWGYIQEKPSDLQAKYTIMNQHLQLLEKDGLSGSIYTQPFDVEGEQNGLMTYDREVVKIPFDSLRKIHVPLNLDMGILPEVAMKNADLTDPGLLYSRMLQQYIDGNREKEFLRKMAIAASQAGDKPGAAMAGSAYISLLKSPLSEFDIEFISQFTKSTKDPGFSFMNASPEQFKKAMGERPFTVAMMNMIYHGEMEPLLNSDNPDWSIIESKVKPYGAPGDEIFLRAKTVAYYNKQDWSDYVPIAKTYLEKYGMNIPEQERSMFQAAVDQHKKQ
jgi:Glycosyl hydrolases family 2, sugar binding domain/Glycosyl hydrolases family 2/Glycosyl hydrolases family 2, TIM barrel domain